MYEALNCRCCGGVLNVNSGLCVCKYCHTTNFISDVASKYIYQLNHANKLRQECEFDNAIRIYDTILGENTPTADILWYRTLCEYGIEYVPDPVSDKYFPTLHRINDESILECSFFKKAIELSEGEQKETLLKEAEYIYKVQTKYLNIASYEDPYDVFICYKETDVETGEKTEDVLLAEELYNELTGMGYKVFFARETLKEKLSIDYEPYIFAALKSARAMAVIGTKAEYFSSVWVKNEWGRFLKLMEKYPDKQMFFACDDPEELPRAFASKQAQILGSEGAIKNLAANMKKFLKDSSSFIRSDSNNIINQDAFDKLIEEKSREYVKRLDRTKFGEKEKSVRDSIWKTYGNVEYKNKIRSNTFHIGSLLIILSQIIISIYFAHSLANPDFYLADKNQKGIFLFCSLVIGLFLVGTVILFSTKIIVDAYKDNSQEAFFVLPGALAIVLYTSLILGVLFYFLLPIIVFAIPFIILIAGISRVISIKFTDKKTMRKQANTHTKQLKDLEADARNEFFNFVKIELAHLKERGDVDDEVEIKDSYYDYIKPKVDELIANNRKYIKPDSQMPVNKLVIFMLLYCSISTVLAIIGLTTRFLSVAV